MGVVRRHCLAQFGDAHHRRILVPARHHRFGGLAAHIFGARIIRETLAEIDGMILTREPRHHLEDRGRQIGEGRVHGPDQCGKAAPMSRGGIARANGDPVSR
jgi:hypothetical protein